MGNVAVFIDSGLTDKYWSGACLLVWLVGRLAISTSLSVHFSSSVDNASNVKLHQWL
jgi:hypothetical protein